MSPDSPCPEDKNLFFIYKSVRSDFVLFCFSKSLDTAGQTEYSALFFFFNYILIFLQELNQINLLV